MQIYDLDGNAQYWHLTGLVSHGKIQNKSQWHLKARNLLVKVYPTLSILEEVPIPIRRSEYLYLDFYIPLVKKTIEIHGEQHYKFVKFYHKNMMGFLKSQKRDREKREWCDINNISYIELPYNQADQWEDIIAKY
jgi:hypothetical protein